MAAEPVMVPVFVVARAAPRQAEISSVWCWLSKIKRVSARGFAVNPNLKYRWFVTHGAER